MLWLWWWCGGGSIDSGSASCSVICCEVAVSVICCEVAVSVIMGMP